jgi:hypothetical protein
MEKTTNENLFTRKEIIHFCMGAALPESDILIYVELFRDLDDLEFCAAVKEGYQLKVQPLNQGKFYIRF